MTEGFQPTSGRMAGRTEGPDPDLDAWKTHKPKELHLHTGDRSFSSGDGFA